MKAAKEVGHRRQPVRWRRSCCAGERPLCRGHPATLPPQSRRAATARTRRDSGGGAEVRAPYRRRRAHSHRPGLCSDKWGASCPDVWSRGRRASAAVGGRWSDVLVLRSRSSRCHRLGVERPPVHATARSDPRNPPLQGRRASDPPPNLALHGKLRKGLRRRESRVAARSGASLTPSRQRPPAQQTRKGGPHACRWTQTRPCWRSCSVPPPGATPSSPICGRHPLGQPAQQGTQTAVNQRRTIQQPRQECPRQETIAVLPPGQLQKTTKKHKAILQRGINQTALLLTEAAKPSNEVPCRRTGRASVAPGPPVVDSAGRRVQTAPSGGGCRRGRCVGYRSS